MASSGSAALAAVLTITLRSGWAFSRSSLALLAHQTMPAVKLWVAVGMETPRVIFSAAEALPAAIIRAQAPRVCSVKLCSILFILIAS